MAKGGNDPYFSAIIWHSSQDIFFIDRLKLLILPKQGADFQYILKYQFSSDYADILM